VHSLDTHHTLTIHSPYTHYTLTIHSLDTHYTLTIHSLYTHHTLKVQHLEGRSSCDECSAVSQYIKRIANDSCIDYETATVLVGLGMAADMHRCMHTDNQVRIVF
jgi:hypothetical protein